MSKRSARSVLASDVGLDHLPERAVPVAEIGRCAARSGQEADLHLGARRGRRCARRWRDWPVALEPGDGIVLLGSFEGLSGRRGPLGKLLGMKVLQRLVVAVPYVQERLDHLGEQLGAGADLLECERPGDPQRPGTAGELPQERVHAPTVDALVPLRPLADSDDAEVDLGVLWQQVCHQVGDTGSERGAGGITDPNRTEALSQPSVTRTRLP